MPRSPSLDLVGVQGLSVVVIGQDTGHRRPLGDPMRLDPTNYPPAGHRPADPAMHAGIERRQPMMQWGGQWLGGCGIASQPACRYCWAPVQVYWEMRSVPIGSFQ